MDGTGPAASGTRRPGRVLGVLGPARARLQRPGVEGCGVGGAEWGPGLAEGAGEDRRERRTRWSAALLSQPPYLSRAAGRGSLLPEEPPAFSPAPQTRRPRGFVYGLSLFSEATGAPAPLAVAQPLAARNLKPCSEAGAPTAPLALASLRSLPAPRAQLPRPGERGRALGFPSARPPVALAWAGARRKRPEQRLDLCEAWVGERNSPHPNPELSQPSSAVQWNPAGAGDRHGAARTLVGGRRLLASLTT